MDCPSSKSSEWAPSLENYLVLQSQQDQLRRRLSINTTASSTACSPQSTSPTTQSPSHSNFSSPTTSFYGATSLPLAPTAPASAYVQVGPEVRQLRDVSQQIKLTLTDLLNCERGRTDDAFRAWIQARLLDAEHELKRQRRRHSSGDKLAADSIGEYFGGRDRY